MFNRGVSGFILVVLFAPGTVAQSSNWQAMVLGQRSAIGKSHGFGVVGNLQFGMSDSGIVNDFTWAGSRLTRQDFPDGM